MLTTMLATARSPLQAALMARSSSQDLLDRQPPVSPPSPTPPRSNSFVASRRAGIVSEQDVLRLAAANFNGRTDRQQPDAPASVARRPSNPRLPPRTNANQVAASPWPAPVLRQQSSDAAVQRRPRPLSTGYLPSSSSDSQIPRHAADSVDAQMRLQNVPILPNRQTIQQPGDIRRRQWSAAQKNDVTSRPVANQCCTENRWRPYHRSSSSGSGDDRQQLEDREAELRSVRTTMERNETAILRALNDQRRLWEAEVASERDAWARRLRDAELLVDDVRQALSDRIRHLELENAALHSSQHDRDGHGPGANDQRLTTSQRPSNGHVDEPARSKVNRLVNGIDGRTQPANNFSSGSTKPPGIRAGQPPTELSGESETVATSRLPVIPEGPVTTRCQHCEETSTELDSIRREFSAEREQWLTEKRRVIAYQKVIQSKYVQLARRCAQLEGAASLEGLDHVDVTDNMSPTNDVSSRTSRSVPNNSAQTQCNAPSMSHRLIPFGQAIET